MRDLDKINDLLETNTINIDKDVYSKFELLPADATIGDLECTKYKYRVNKKMYNFDKLLGISLKELFKDIQIKTKEYNNYPFKVTDTYEETTSRFKQRGIIAGTYVKNNEIIECQAGYYGAACELVHDCDKGINMRVLIDKNDKVYKFAPEGFTKAKYSIITPNKDIKKEINLPVILFRMLYNEYNFRRLVHNTFKRTNLF